MQVVREITTNKVLFLFDDMKKVTITDAGLITPLRAINIKPDTHDVVNAPLPPVDFVGGKLAFDGAWTILDQEYYDSLFAKRIRDKRDNLLNESDWVTIRSYDLGQDMPSEWSDYRSDLRDIPQQVGFPYNITWPEKPTT